MGAIQIRKYYTYRGYEMRWTLQVDMDTRWVVGIFQDDELMATAGTFEDAAEIIDEVEDEDEY